MKREIKFRGLRTDGKGWAIGDIVTAYDGLFICPSDYHYKHYNEYWPDGFAEVHPETVGQFTGLRDRNGKEIYEGDVVMWGDHPNGRELQLRHAVVEVGMNAGFRIIHYSDPNTGEHLKGDNYLFKFGTFQYQDTEKYLTVTGNIHEPCLQPNA